MASSVSKLPKLAKRERDPNRRKTPGFPILIGILTSVCCLLAFALYRAIDLGIF